MLITTTLLALAALGILIYSMPWLRSPRSHGFFRFFAFEGILALVALHVNHWFRDPLSWHQIVSWLLLIASAGLAIHGFHLLHAIGKPSGDFEATTHLVRVGAYRYIRHPLYASLLWLAWGVFFKLPSLPGGALALAATGFLYATARVEEAENLRRFGTEYLDYMDETRMFVPFVL